MNAQNALLARFFSLLALLTLAACAAGALPDLAPAQNARETRGEAMAVAANPYLQFTARVEESGTFRFTWTDDDGTTVTAEDRITVS